MQIANDICPGYVIRPELHSLYDAIFRYCMMLQGPYDISKGLFIYGSIGTGKTTLLAIIREFCAMVRPPDVDGGRYSFRITNAIDVCAQFAAKGYDGIQTYICRNPEAYIGLNNINTEISRQAFDELGSEAQITQHYGTAENVFQYILQQRYDRRDRNITHITTNLEPSQLKDVYGMRIYDRCKEMFNFVQICGRTFRGI